MCADAPVHHANHTNDLSRVGHGLYALSGTGEVNAAKELARKLPVAPAMEEPSTEPANPSWHWEGNVQAAMVTGLASQGWAIQAVSDTESRAAGTDIVATRGGRRLHVEVKGYPTTTYARGAKAGSPMPTNPATQARHWFAGALLKAAMLRNDHPDDLVAMGFPDFSTYRTLAARVSTTLERCEVALIWIGEEGDVDIGLDPAN
jgi:hypothetical protein